MTKKYRNSIQISFDILNLIKDTPNCTKYNLFMKTGTSYTQLENYLQMLIKIGYISANNGNQFPNPNVRNKIIYKVTDKGLQFLKSRTINELFNVK